MSPPVLGRSDICHTIAHEEGSGTQHYDARVDLECATLLECRVAFEGGVCKAGRPTAERGNADGASACLGAGGKARCASGPPGPPPWGAPPGAAAGGVQEVF